MAFYTVGIAILLLRSVDACSGDDCAETRDEFALLQIVKNKGEVKSGRGESKPYYQEGATIQNGREGKLIINEDGVDKTYYLPGAETIDDGKTVKYNPPYRYYLMNQPSTDYKNASLYYQPIFPGKTFTVDMMMDGVSCGCNLNFYLVDGPVDFPGGDGDYYCDAQCFPDKGCCSEFDMNEGNNEAQQITNHACTHDYPQHPDWQCHKWGDPTVHTHPSDFAPGGGSTIDSNRWFTYSQKFERVGNDDLRVITTISQGDRKVVMSIGGDGNPQMKSMLQDMLGGMVFVTGYWFDKHMNWLDKEACGSGEEHCSENPAYIKNWRLTTNGGGPVPSPSPTPPSPSPTPTPPSPGPGKCCWGGNCNTGCENNPGAWCNQAQGNCEGACGGQWCR